MTPVLQLAVPSKGAMEEPTMRFLSACGLGVRRADPRRYSASIGMGNDLQAVFQRAADIPHKLAAGLVDAGITGYDIFTEHLGDAGDVIVAVDDLGFARCSLVLAVPEAWLDVSTIEDLADVAAEFQQRGRSLRVATKFPRLVRQFLLARGLAGHTLVEGSGALEIAPSMGYADLIADINETGTTLRANHLKPLSGGTILRSQACLLVNRQRLLESSERREAIRGMLEMIEAHQRAREMVSVTANVEGSSMQEVAGAVLRRRDLAGMRGPTVTPVYDPEQPDRVFAVTLVVSLARLSDAKDHLRACGGGAITVQQPLYV
ncbi:MAG: ATP phosphoribosyltransferase, partial [Chloroflexota bacterium]